MNIKELFNLLEVLVNQKVKQEDNQTVNQNDENKHPLTTKSAKTQKLTYIIINIYIIYSYI